MLHFSYWYKKLPILVDSGRPTYNCTAESEHYISSRAHNSLSIDGLPPLPDCKNMLPAWYHTCNSDVHASTDENSAVYTITSNCFKRIHKSIVVERMLSISKNQLIITDGFKGNGEHKVNLMFHFHQY